MKPRKPEVPGNYRLRPGTLTNESGWMHHPQPIKDWPQSLFAILIFGSLELMELLNPSSWEALADLNPNSVRSICSQIQLGWIVRLSRLSTMQKTLNWQTIKTIQGFQGIHQARSKFKETNRHSNSIRQGTQTQEMFVNEKRILFDRRTLESNRIAAG